MYKKTFLASLILSVLIFSSSVFATTNTSTLVADVDIQNAEITFQKVNDFNISFSVSNKEGVQSGLYYAVQLISKEGGVETIADQKVYDEVVNLAENTTIKKDIVYSAPSSLSGSYTILLAIRNSSGFPFGLFSLGEVNLENSPSGVFIDTPSCTTNIEQSKKLYGLFNVPVSVNPGQSFVITCSATNKSNSEISVSTNFETRIQSSFGEKIESIPASNPTISFYANEKKNISINVPVPSKPQRYSTSFRLSSNGTVSNPVNFDFIVKGDSATISNISLDKDYYKKGETAKMSIVWFSSTKDISLEASLMNSNGELCAEKIQKVLDRSSAQTMISITKNCKNPSLSVSIKDANGNILDQKDFSSKSSSKNTSNILFAILGLVLLIAIVSVFKKGKHKEGDGPVSTNPMRVILPIIILAGIGSLIPFNKVSADTYVSVGPDDFSLCISSEVYVDPASYSPNATMTVKWRITNNCLTSANVRLHAFNNDGSGGPYPFVELMAPLTLPAGGSTGIYLLYNDWAFTSPSPSGTYNIEFETGVDTDLVPIGTGGGSGPESYYVCFTADTKVAMADGTYKNIQDVKIGDVLKGETGNNTVLAYHRPTKSDGVIFGFNGGRAFVTEEHPFKTTEGWKSINPDKTRQENIGITVTKLEVGDVIITETGQTKINSIESKIVPEDTPLYNFVLSGDRTYFADGYLVHNKNVCGGTGNCIDNSTAPYYLVPPGDPRGDVVPLSCTAGQIFEGPYEPVKFIPNCGGYYRYVGCYPSPNYKACGNSTP